MNNNRRVSEVNDKTPWSNSDDWKFCGLWKRMPLKDKTIINAYRQNKINQAQAANILNKCYAWEYEDAIKALGSNYGL
ncbi:MAG: hypothetical protein FWD14_01990 [Treponema sp.]|nr:hypothetical protein [Treponema sp.]